MELDYANPLSPGYETLGNTVIRYLSTNQYLYVTCRERTIKSFLDEWIPVRGEDVRNVSLRCQLCHMRIAARGNPLA